MAELKEITLQYPLRPGFVVRMVVPAGLKLEEADRLHALLLLYALPPDHFDAPAAEFTSTTTKKAAT